MTMSVVGLYLLGGIGAWRLATVFPVNRFRIAGMVIYVGTPPSGLMSRYDWSALACLAVAVVGPPAAAPPGSRLPIRLRPSSTSPTVSSGSGCGTVPSWRP